MFAYPIKIYKHPNNREIMTIHKHAVIEVYWKINTSQNTWKHTETVTVTIHHLVVLSHCQAVHAIEPKLG